jgi:uncharacterized protein (DUF983 family)
MFGRWLRVRRSCGECGYTYVREDGYWLGAMIVNIAVAEVVFLGLFVGGMITTWPDVPWNLLLVVSVGAMVATPFLFLPWSRAIWVAIDLGILQRLEPGSDADEVARRNAP